MRFQITKYNNHEGWYIGRPFRWVGVFLLGVASFLGAWILGFLVTLAGLPGEYALLLMPLPVGILAFKDLFPKFMGEPISYAPPFQFMHKKEDFHDDPLLEAKRSEEPRIWFAVMFLDTVMWLWVLIGLLVLLNESGALELIL